ncbi:MAG: iron-sulfur cluster assembly scaffold protein [Candidatus Omnitrophica bacterium]|nr:iron-sulfur cluster assembly scaffold protein [Candidatus Omnitrophota bacterium]
MEQFNTQYSEKVMEHFKNPKNVGEIPDADGVGNVGNAVCGDIMKLYIKVRDNIIVDAKFKTFGCLPAKEEVVLNYSGWEGIDKIRKGIKVINSSGKSTHVAETYKRKYKGKLLRILPFVSPFNSFSVTPNHPVLCIKRKKVRGGRISSSKCTWLQMGRSALLSTEPDYTNAKNLEAGDYLIFVVNKIIKDDKFFTKELMRFLGYYLSEGYIVAKGSAVAFAFNKNEKKAVSEVASLIFKLTGKKASQRIRGNVLEIYVCSRKLARFLRAHCGCGARNKTLSEEILSLPFDKQWQMVETYIIGDGDRYRRRPKDTETCRIVTTSKKLAIQVQQILARGGIFASIRNIFKTGCKINNRILKDSEQYLISFKSEKRHNFVKNGKGYFLVPIRNIKEKRFSGQVYNFQVASEPNSYLVKGFAVHNCGAAIATSSMVTELVKGKTVDEALKISNRAVAEALGGLPSIKMHCSLLAEQALKSAIDDYLKKSNKKKA